MTPRRFIRIVVKAVLMLVVFDAVQAALDLDRRLESLSLYRHFVPPLARLDSMRDYPTPVMWRLDPLLDAHRIGRAKRPDEFRVAVLGDSGTFGMFVPERKTVPGQMTRVGGSFRGRKLVAYNLSYQTPNTLKDLLVEKHALRRKLDAIVWFVTLFDLARDAPPAEFRREIHLVIRVNADDLPELERKYGIDTWETREIEALRGPFDRSVLGDGGRYRDFAILLGRAFFDRLAGDDPTESVRAPRPWVGSRPLPATPLFFDRGPNDPPMPNARWKNLEAGARMAKEARVPLLLVNDPLFLASGPNSEHEYNSYYGREIYDRYRRDLAAYCRRRGIDLLDLWNLLPPREFDDMPQHYTPAGSRRIAEAVVRRLEGMTP
jgi:hypothetical protein